MYHSFHVAVKDGAEDSWTKSTALESTTGATFKEPIVEHTVDLQYRDYVRRYGGSKIFNT